MSYTKEQLVEALYQEYLFLIHDDYEEGVDATPEEYLAMLNGMEYDELVEETNTADEGFSLNEFMEVYG